MKREILTLPAPEVRFAADDAGTFTGYASVWNERDSYGDTIKKGAFAKTLVERKKIGGPSMFWNHDPDKPIGVWTELVEDERGLKVSGQLVTETVLGAEVRALLIAGAVNGLSIGFRARKTERGPNGGRVLVDIELVEISLVSLPAASKARVTSVKHAAKPAGTAVFLAAARRAASSIKGQSK